jgi:hypothetical protein
VSRTLYGGNWNRLDLAEMALKSCVFDRVNSGKKPAMTFGIFGAPL